jgi:predicted helicase
LYLADTLSNPFEIEQNLGAQYLPIARSRTSANKVKATDRVVVVIGNPPYKEKSKGKGGWVETGAAAASQAAPLAEFIPPKDWGLGAHVKHLYNPYVFFWRWATWKVFDGHPGDRGVVAFITVAGFLNGPGFGKMREYLRRVSDAIWVIDCSPEGHQPEVATRVFQGVQQPVCIVLAVKDGTTDAATPAPVHFTTVSGHREDKFAQLAALTIESADWRGGATGWSSPLQPASSDGWAAMPSIEDLLAWSGSGTMPGRTWVFGPDPTNLRARWHGLISAPADAKADLLAEHKRRFGFQRGVMVGSRSQLGCPA